MSEHALTSPVSQPERSWLKEEAPRNIEFMVVTDPVFQLLRSLLKEEAPENM